MKIADGFIIKERNNNMETGDVEDYVSFADVHPQWLHDAVYEAHDEELPNDWRFSTALVIATALDEYEEDEEHDRLDIDEVGDWAATVADQLVDFENYKLLTWLAENLRRIDDEAIEELVTKDDGVIRRVQLMQYLAIEQMATIIANAYIEAAYEGVLDVLHV